MPDCSGDLYKHLGHFSQDKYIRQGHNDSGKIPINTPPPSGQVSVYDEDEAKKIEASFRGATGFQSLSGPKVKTLDSIASKK